MSLSYAKFVGLYKQFYFGKFAKISGFPTVDDNGKIIIFCVDIAKGDDTYNIEFHIVNSTLKIVNLEIDDHYEFVINQNHEVRDILEFFLKIIAGSIKRTELQIEDINPALLEKMVQYDLLEIKTTITYTLKS